MVQMKTRLREQARGNVRQAIRQVQPYGQVAADVLVGPAHRGVLSVPFLYYLPH